jgi:hypothetical protein
MFCEGEAMVEEGLRRMGASFKDAMAEKDEKSKHAPQLALGRCEAGEAIDEIPEPVEEGGE